MTSSRFVLMLCLLPLLVFALPVRAAEFGEFQVKREGPFEFDQEPQVTRDGDRVTIRFKTKAFCDVTVAIENADGRIVRHLASGVLGENAPGPFRKNSLTQTVVWDGKDDEGRYLDDKNSLAVRVSLGLGARFERHFQWSPHRRLGNITPLFSATPEGVYVFGGNGVDSLRLFGHEGNYVRTVYPFPAGKLDELVGVKTHTFPQSGKTKPLKGGFYETTLLTSGLSGLRNEYMAPRSGPGATAMAVRNGRIALAGVRLNRFATDGSSGGMPLEGPETSFKVRRWWTLPRSAALSPDGRTVYVTGFVRDEGYRRNHKWIHGVGKIDMRNGEKMQVFAGSLDLGKKHGRSGPGQFKTPSCVDCDAKGRVYVADHFNDRVQVFAPDGRHLKSIQVRRPSDVCIDQRKGDIYVFSWFLDGGFRTEGKPEPPELIHFGPFENPEILARYPIRMRDNYDGNGSYADRGRGCQYRGMIDSWAPGESGPTIWLVAGRMGKTTLASPGINDCTIGGRDPGKHGWAADARRRAAAAGRGAILVYRIEKGKPVLLKDFSREAASQVPRVQVPFGWRNRLFPRPTTGELYVLADGLTHRPLVFDPDTGKSRVLDAPFAPEDMAFDINGLAYLRTHHEIVRYDPDNWREVPFDYGEERTNVGLWNGKRAGRVISAVPIPTRSIHLQPGIWVSPRGHICVAFYNKQIISGRESRGGQLKKLYAGWKPWRPQIFPGRGGAAIVQVWDKHGQLLHEDAIRGVGKFHGIAIDKDDDLYLGSSSTRMFGKARYWDYMTGTLIKFRPDRKILATSAKIKLDGNPDRPPDTADGGLGAAWWEGAEWFYGGIGFTGKDGKHAAGGCHCWNYRITQDYFARSFAPETQHYTVAVLDTNGNLILRVGRYGNVDDGVPLVRERKVETWKPTPLGGDEVALFYPVYLGTHTDRRLFIADPGNQRILSAKLGYRTTATLPLKDVPETE